ncbi:MAG TPA: oxidoreductase, partial [Planctomycetaceae bacterium]|nr:oxidoreductase [Planctomycetaceae bacterium]
MSTLSGKTALVTGASKGIGAGIARELAGRGAAVVVNDASDRAGAEQVVESIVADGGRATAIGADVANPDEVARLIDGTLRAFGRIDILVNNA